MITKRTLLVAAIVGWVVLLLFGIIGTANATTDKVTICHAAGQADTTHYITLTISENAVYGAHGQAGHFEENGTPAAGHEQDYFGACEEPQTPEKYVLRRLMPKGRDAAVLEAQPPLSWSCEGGFQAGPLQLDIIDHKLGSAVRLFLKLPTERVLVDSLGYPGGEDRYVNRPWQFGPKACF